MRKISAQYVFTSAGNPLRRGVVTTGDDGTIISVEDTGGYLPEEAGIEFYNGILIPGLVNCHAHLELSHMHGTVPAVHGLAEFISSVRERREAGRDEIITAAQRADRELLSEGVVACADISNNSLTFDLKIKSAVNYLTFIEVFGINPLRAENRNAEALETAACAAAVGLPYQITPHSVYSVSRTLFSLLERHISPTSVISLHFLESPDERDLVTHRRGDLAESYRSLGMQPEHLEPQESHTGTAIALSHLAGQLILVHNTFINEDELGALAPSSNTWFCLCPSSNMRITKTMPPVGLLRKATANIVAGTDSLASTDRLSMLTELRLLHEAAADIPLEEIIRWGTINGARALQMSGTLGSIEPGKKPGLLLIEEADLALIRLLPHSRVRRLL